MGSIARVVAGLVCGVLVACGPGDEDRRGASSHVTEPVDPPPETREGFLAELLPLPFDALVIVYDVRGPAGLHGTLEVLARPGGNRRHNWRLELPIEGKPSVRVEGSSVTTPDVEWSEGEDGSVARARIFGALADAYLQASPQERAQVIASVRRWHAELERGRAAHPATVQTLAGIECLETRFAGRRVCLWEATGIALRDEGSAFVVEARSVELGPTLGRQAFEAPVDPPTPAFDATTALRALAEGDVTLLAGLGRPASWPASGDPAPEI